METPVAFPIEYHSTSPQLTDDLKAKVEQRLQKLAKGYHDITGAAVSLEKPDNDKTAHTFRARVVLYHRPNNLAAIEKHTAASKAVLGALDAVARQLRDERARLRERSRHGGA